MKLENVADYMILKPTIGIAMWLDGTVGGGMCRGRVRSDIVQFGIDSVLKGITEEYGESNLVQDILIAKSAYKIAISEAKKKGLDVSEYPKKLNHLDYKLL